MINQGFIRSYYLEPEKIGLADRYPYSIPAIGKSLQVNLSPTVTFFVGENGTGKSTIIEALAVNAGFNAEGGSINVRFSTRSTESPLYEALRLVRNPGKERTGYFLRAESFYNVASKIDELDAPPGGAPIIDSYGGTSLHLQSHGESFMALVTHRFGPQGLYILDEPEAALSPARQLALLRAMHTLVQKGSQFIIATHSPILLAFPEALIYQTTPEGLQPIAYTETAHYTLTRDFLNHPDLYLKKLFQH